MITLSTSALRPRATGADEWLPWNTLTGMWLRKHGFVFKEVVGQDLSPSAFCIVPNGVGAASHPKAGFFEGPFSRAFLAELGISARMVRAEVASLRIAAGSRESSVLELRYSRDILRAIPRERGIKSDPYIWQPDSPCFGVRQVPMQVFETGDEWRVLAYAILKDGAQAPTVITNGRVTLTGLPVFDLVCRKHWMPPITDGYYMIETEPVSPDADRWLAELIKSAALTAGSSVISVDPWPHQSRAALTVRFDHDRLISGQSLDDLLNVLDVHGHRASWAFLKRLSPPEAISAVRARGHEITLHTEADGPEAFQREVLHFHEAGIELRGVTAHGGIGSAGHLGQTYFDWAREAGTRHAELLSRNTLAPHPVVAVRGNKIVTEDFFVLNAHRSLDSGTAPNAHQLDKLMETIPAQLAAGELVTIMNHPDIHREELKTLLNTFAGSDIWKATHAEVVDWLGATRFGWTLESSGEEASLHFPRLRNSGVGITVVHPGGEELRLNCQVDSSVVRLPSEHDPAPSIAQKEKTIRVGSNLHDHGPKTEKLFRSDTVPVGIFCATRGQADSDLEAAGGLADQVGDKSNHRYLAQMNGGYWFPDGADRVGSAFVPLSAERFSTVFLGRSLRLFHNAWGKAFVAHAVSALKPGGRLVTWYSKAARSQGFWRLQEFIDFFGTEPLATDNGHAVFLLDRVAARPRSVLDWHYEAFSDIILHELQGRVADSWDFAELDRPLYRSMLVNAERREWKPGEFGANADALWQSTKHLLLPQLARRSFAEEVDTIVFDHSYLIGGASYKSALVSEIVRQHGPQRPGLRVCDVGGAHGLLAAELLLAEEAGPVATAINLDLNVTRAILGTRMYGAHVGRFEGCFRFWLGFAQDYSFDEQYDVVSFIGALLYVPKEVRQILLDKVWAALAPGGVLIVHENIKAAAFSRDYAVMFTVDEIDQLLARYGTIHRYLSTAVAPVDRDAAGARTVFRAVVKP